MYCFFLKSKNITLISVIGILLNTKRQNLNYYLNLEKVKIIQDKLKQLLFYHANL